VPDADVPDSKLLAAAAARPAGSPAEQATALAKQAAGAGSSAQAALRTALTLGGIDVADVGGVVVAPGDKPKLGIVVPAGEISLMTGQNTIAHGLSAADFTADFAALIGKKANQDKLRQALLDGLRAMGPRKYEINRYPVTSQFLAAFVIDLGLDAKPPVDLTESGVDDVQFTGLQSWLIFLLLAGGFAQAAADVHAGHPGPSPSPAAFRGQQRSSLGTSGNCSTADNNGKVMDAVAMALSAYVGGIPISSFSGLVGLIPESADLGKAAGAAEYLAAANAMLALAHIIAEDATFNAKMSLDGGEPLTRTQSTHAPGERDKITLHVTFDIGRGEYANCFRTLLNLAGADFGGLPNDGPITKASVQWEMYNDEAGILNNPTQFYLLAGSGTAANGSSVQSVTDDNGDAKIGIEGRPQPRPLPPDPHHYIRRVKIVAGLQIKANNMYNDLTDAVSAFLGGPIAGTASVIVGLLEHTHAMSVVKSFEVQDWLKDFKWDTHIDYRTSEGYPHVSGMKCGGLEGEWQFGPGVSFTLDQDGYGTYHDKFWGDMRVTFDPGPPAKIRLRNKYVRQAFTVIPGNFCDD
jgi:hypothetical protein